MNELILKIPIYNFRFKLVLVDNVKDYILQNKIYDYCSAWYKVLVIDFSESDFNYDCLVVFSEEGIRNSIVAHEAFHIAVLTLKTRGVKLSDDSEEAYAYLIDYLVKILEVNLIKLKQIKNGDNSTSEQIQSPTIRS